MDLTIHRSADEIGGNCIELKSGGHRILLDIGRPLDAASKDVPAAMLLPQTLDRSTPAVVVLSHPHQDHYGLLPALPDDWPVWCGAATEKLIRLSGELFGLKTDRTFTHYRHGEPFVIGPFRITPFLTDHSAFDAHMLLVEAGGTRVFYTGDFRMCGRKSALVSNLMANPPSGIDALLMEGTTLGRDTIYPTEGELEEQFATLFRRTMGRVFITWSAQNIDRTVTLVRACIKTGRKLVIDLYTAEVLRVLGENGRLPQPDWSCIRVVVTGRLGNNYRRQGKEDLIDACVRNGIGAAKLQTETEPRVIMLRPGLLADYQSKGVVPGPADAWSFSMWEGYLKGDDVRTLEDWFRQGGSNIEHIHTSGHAAPGDLRAFASALSPKRLIPIHSFKWDENVASFRNVTRLKDGETIQL